MQRVGEIDLRVAIRQGLLHCAAVFDRDVRQIEQVSQDRSGLCRCKTAVAAHDPLQLQDHRLAHHQRLARLHEAPSSQPLALRFRIRIVFEVVAGEDGGVEANHRLNSSAGSKSAGTALRRLLSMPNPLPDMSVGELRMAARPNSNSDYPLRVITVRELRSHNT